MEDGATIAVCLTRSGKAHVQEAVAAFEALRYERVRAAQKTGEATRVRFPEIKLSLPLHLKYSFAQRVEVRLSFL